MLCHDCDAFQGLPPSVGPHPCHRLEHHDCYLCRISHHYHWLSLTPWAEVIIIRGDLLRSVPHIKFGDKIKSHRYLDHSGWLGLIYCSNYRDHWRLLLFELETKILWLLKSVCHTVTLRFLHALGPIKAIYLLFMLPNATNFSLNLEHISDFRYIHKQKSYAPNGDFVPFAKFGFVTVWQRKFEYFLPIIGFQKGQSNFLHDFIQVKASQKHITWKI